MSADTRIPDAVHIDITSRPSNYRQRMSAPVDIPPKIEPPSSSAIESGFTPASFSPPPSSSLLRNFHDLPFARHMHQASNLNSAASSTPLLASTHLSESFTSSMATAARPGTDRRPAVGSQSFESVSGTVYHSMRYENEQEAAENLKADGDPLKKSARPKPTPTSPLVSLLALVLWLIYQCL